MITQKINKKVHAGEDLYRIYLGILEAMSNFKITDQEKKVLAIILSKGSVTKEVKEELVKITSKARIENILSKFRSKKILIGDQPNKQFPNITGDTINLTITISLEKNNS